MKLLLIAFVSLLIAAWLGTLAGHWMDKRAAISRRNLEEITP